MKYSNQDKITEQQPTRT